MSLLLQHCRKAFRSVWWCLAMAVLVFGLSGCKNCETPDAGLRHSDLSATAHKARSEANKSDAKKGADDDDLLMSDKAKQISRDLE